MTNQNQYELDYFRKIQFIEVSYLFDFKALLFYVSLKLFSLYQCFLNCDTKHYFPSLLIWNQL